MKTYVWICGVLLVSGLVAGGLNAASHSDLWGKSGEKWESRGRLPDFSRAGYQRGDYSLPEVGRGVSVKIFGARGDGIHDDTEAFENALVEVGHGVIEVPPGRYRITRILEIHQPNQVLKGAGPEETVLVFPIPLNEVRPNWGATTTGQRTSNYSWSGGFVWMRGKLPSRPLARIVQPARRGDESILVAEVSRLRAGQWVDVYQKDNPDNSLAIHLYSGDAGPVGNLKGRTRTSLICQVRSVKGKRVYLDRPLRSDLRPEWHSELRGFHPTVTNSGIENLSFEFPGTPYKGHFTELGFNAIALSGVVHCWVRNVHIRNAESGIFVSGYFNTVQGVVMESQRGLDGQQCVGHHGISIGGGDNLVTDFDIRARYIHDITVSHHCAGNVVSRGRGLDLSLDHHRYAPYENLFTDLDAGRGTRLWKCGGGAALGKHCGARGTFWNIRSARPLGYPPPGFGPDSMNLVGLQTASPSEKDSDGKWFEAIPPQALEPKNLHQAQLKRRLGAKLTRKQ